MTASMRSDRAELLATLGTVSGGHFLSHLYILVYPPLFPFLVEDFGLNNTQLGAIMSVVALTTFLLQTPVGELVDRVGAKRVFVAGVALSAGGTALVGFADSYPLLLLFALLAGSGQAAFHPADYSLLDAVTDSDREGKSFSVHTFAGYAGFAVAPALVGGLAVVLGWQTALFIVGGVGLGYAVAAQFLLNPVYRRQAEQHRTTDEDEDDAGVRTGLSALTQPTILALFAFFVVITMANKGIQTFTTVFVVEQLSLSSVVGNTALTGYFALAAAGVLAGGVLADRYDVRAIIVWSLSVAAAGVWLAATGVGTSRTVIVALFAAVGLFYGIALPARDRLINAASTAGSTGKSFGFVYTGLPLGGFVAPALLGAIIDFTGAPSIAFLLVGVFYLGAAGVVVGLALRAGRSRSLLPLTEADR